MLTSFQGVNMSKSFATIALASLLSLPGFAMADVGLEVDTAGYTVSGTGGGSFSAVASYDTSGYTTVAGTAITPIVGSQFGLLTTATDTPTFLTYNFDTLTNAGDVLYLRLVADDANPAIANDSFTVNLFDVNGAAYFTQTYSGASLAASTGYYPDYGWTIALGVAQGTKSFTLALTNDVDDTFDPVLAVDYYNSPVVVASNVPEASTSALSLAGLAVCGLLARRRKQAR
jgi:hypothetical protein